jgi:hypothetical protein
MRSHENDLTTLVETLNKIGHNYLQFYKLSEETTFYSKITNFFTRCRHSNHEHAMELTKLSTDDISDQLSLLLAIKEKVINKMSPSETGTLVNEIVLCLRGHDEELNKLIQIREAAIEERNSYNDGDALLKICNADYLKIFENRVSVKEIEMQPT